MSVIDYRKYIGRPYEKYNCLDVVKEFYMDHFGIKVSDYYEGNTPDREQVETLIISNKGDFVCVRPPPIVGDIVVIMLFGIECHIGVCVGNGQFIHSTKTIGSNMEKLSRYEKLISGYYRHRNKNDSP